MHDENYLNLVDHVLRNGEYRGDRTGTGTISVFGHQSRYDLRDGFPLLTTKKIRFDAIVRELLWFIRGSTNIHDGLAEHTPIWNAWADEKGELGPIYGAQWRNWGGHSHQYQFGIDQLSEAIDLIKLDPTSRRIIVSAWNVGELHLMALPPCHTMFQFYVHGQFLDLHLYQRSADIALGVPYNIASYALLLSMVANECGLAPRHFIHTLGDAHIYVNHEEGLRKQLEREPRPSPRLRLSYGKAVDDILFDDVYLFNYDPHPFIKFEVSV